MSLQQTYATELRTQASKVLESFPDLPATWHDGELCIAASAGDGFEVVLQPDSVGIIVVTGFRDLLCEQIAKIVSSVEWRGGEALTVRFEEGSALSISLRKEDYRCAEAYYAHGFRDNAWMVE